MASNIDAAYDLKLYVLGKSGNSESAMRTVQKICATHLKDNCHLTIVDLAETPEKGRQDCILATPTLIRKKPTPEYRIIGDLSELEKVVHLLGIKSK